MNNLIARRESQTISINFLSIWLSQINNLIIQVMTFEKKNIPHKSLSWFCDFTCKNIYLRNRIIINAHFCPGGGGGRFLLQFFTLGFPRDSLLNLYSFQCFYCRTCKVPSVCSSVRQHLPWVSCERNSSYSFILIFLKLCRLFSSWWGCACGLDIIVGLFFITFSTLWTYSFFDLNV